MIGKTLSLAACTGAVVFTALIQAWAQTPADRRPYEASLGDLMTMVVQPRHLKLGLAGQERNWAYAGYELRELQGAFRRIAHAVPVYRSTDLAALITATTAGPLEAVETAIKSADAGGFTEAYGRLTATCNACHQSTEHGAVVIRVPRASSFPDQDFHPQR